MLSPKKLIQNARNRISKRENWANGELSVGGDPVSPDATSWCALGSLYAEAGFVSGITGIHRAIESYSNSNSNSGAPEELFDAGLALDQAVIQLSGEGAFDHLPGLPGWANGPQIIRESVATHLEYSGKNTTFKTSGGLAFNVNDTLGHEAILMVFDRAGQNLLGE